MRHNRDEKRFDRTIGHLRCMLANMTSDLVMHGRLKTTTQRAKLLRRYAERMITLGKAGSLAARRRAMAFMRRKSAVTKLFAEVAPMYKERNGGYTRILKLGERPGDNASISIIELVESTPAAKAQPKPARKAAPRAKAPAKAAAGKQEKRPAKTSAPEKKKAAKAKA